MVAQALELVAAADERRRRCGWRRTRARRRRSRRASASRRGWARARARRVLGLQQTLELGLDLRPGRDAELVAQQRAQLVVHAQRLDHVALRLAHAHQEQVAALAERRPLDQLLRGPLGGRQLGAADREAGVAAQLARLQAEILQPPSRVLQPRRLVAGQQPGVGELGDAAGGLDHGRPVAAVARGERGVERRLRLVEVDCASDSSCTARSPAFSITPAPSARRSFDSTTLSACEWVAGASSPHSAAISRSRVTARDRFSARWASANRP